MALAANTLELLAPARTAEIGIEAIKHGADAVYIGGPGFGARAQAANSVSDIGRLVEYAHRYHAKILVALNTILRDDELEPARQQIWDLYQAGVDALIVQDMGLLMLDLPPIQLHASTQCDIRSPEKARFLQDVGFTQIVLARELDLGQIAEIRAATDPSRCTLEFFIHGALCVAYSGQCYISHAHSGRSANRGECSQACRLPYTVTDGSGAIVAHEKHVLSIKDNRQSDNLGALVQAGIRSFKIEGRYKDMAYVKNTTAHYRQRLDQLMQAEPQYRAASSGYSSFSFVPAPEQNFNRDSTDYFVHGRKADIGAFDTPKHSGLPLGWVEQVHGDSIDVSLHPGLTLSNGDGLSYFDRQGELQGMVANRVQALQANEVEETTANENKATKQASAAQNTPALRYRIYTKDPTNSYRDLRADMPLSRNRDMQWQRQMERESAKRRIPITVTLSETEHGFALQLRDNEGHQATGQLHTEKQRAQKNPDQAPSLLRQALAKFGDSEFTLQPTPAAAESENAIQLQLSAPWYIPSAQLNTLRRETVQALQDARKAAYTRPSPGTAIEPPVPYPQAHLSYLANAYNQQAFAFYHRHGVEVVDAAYESQQELGEVSLMITKHCVRYALSLCPKQAKGVIGVQGTVRAEPLMLRNGNEHLTLEFDCKPCEMHVRGKMKKHVKIQGPGLV